MSWSQNKWQSHEGFKCCRRIPFSSLLRAHCGEELTVFRLMKQVNGGYNWILEAAASHTRDVDVLYLET